jgi:hypothetical protein
MQKRFKELTERKFWRWRFRTKKRTDGFMASLRIVAGSYPATADMFEEMRVEEVGHRDRLFEEFRGQLASRFRQYAAGIKDFYSDDRCGWCNTGRECHRKHASDGDGGGAFYQRAAGQVTHAGTKNYLINLPMRSESIPRLRETWKKNT